MRPVAQKLQVSGQPDWLDRHSERRPSRHENRLHRPAVGGVEEHLLGAVRRQRIGRGLERGERDLSGQRVAKLERKVGHLGVRGSPTRSPLPYLARAIKGLTAGGKPFFEQSEIHVTESARWPCTKQDVFSRNVDTFLAPALRTSLIAVVRAGANAPR